MDKVLTISEEAPKLIIHNDEEEATRANIPDVEGAESEERLEEEDASLLLELMEIMWLVSHSYFHLSFIFIEMNLYSLK